MSADQGWTVYILQCADNSLYTGITTDVENRIATHEAGQGAKYLRGRGPLKLVYREDCATRAIATKRELEIKSWSRAKKCALFA